MFNYFRSEFFSRAIAVTAVNLARTIQLLVVSWSAQFYGGSFASVGQTLFWSNAATFFVSPFAGHIIDRFDRSLVSIGGAIMFLTNSILLALGALGSLGDPFIVLQILCPISAVLISVLIATQEAMLHSRSNPGERAKLGPVINSARQFGLVLGALLGGVLISISIPIAFVATGILMFAGLLPFFRYRSALNDKPTGASLQFSGILVGFRFMGAVPVLCCVLITTSAYAIGQVINSTLPSLVKSTMRLSAWHYGVLDASWSVGALATALFLARLKAVTLTLSEASISLIGMAVVLAAVTLTNSFPLAVICLAILGVTFSFSKVVSDSRLFELIDPEVYGRVRSNISMCISALGILIYALPTVVSGLTPELLLQCTSLVAIGCAIICFLLSKRELSRVLEE